MKMNDEMCNAEFARLPLKDKQWLLLFAYEAVKAREKFPSMGKDIVHAAAVVAEEAGELVRAALHVEYEEGRYYDMHGEAIQVGATALRFCIEGAPELPYPEPPKAKSRSQASEPMAGPIVINTPLAQRAQRLCMAIEQQPASEKQTEAALAASSLLAMITKL